jgi:hypothetical protein
MTQETKVYSKMIRQNYRTIPFRSDHLFNALRSVLGERKGGELPYPNNNELKEHGILGPFLSQYAEPSLDYRSLANIAVEWWIQILRNFVDYRRELLEECMKYISFCLCTQRTKSGILTGVRRNENARNAAELWGFFLFRCTVHNYSLNRYAWLAIRANCRELFSNKEQIQDAVLYGGIPYHIVKFIWENKRTSETKKVTYQVRITDGLKYETDFNRLEEGLAKCLFRYKKEKSLLKNARVRELS